MGTRIAIVLALVWAGCILPAQADMIEIKGRGVLNGKIVSQDDKEVRFEDSGKNIFVVPKGDVLFLEAQTDAPISSAKSPKKMGSDWGTTFQHWGYKAERVFKDTRYFVKEKIRWASGAANKPLDRSGANGRADALAESMSDLTGNLKKLNKKERGINQETMALENNKDLGAVSDGMVQRSARVGNRISKAATDRRVSHTKHVDKGVKRYQNVSSFSLD